MNSKSNTGIAWAHIVPSAVVVICFWSLVSGCNGGSQKASIPPVAGSKPAPSPTVAADTTNGPDAAIRDLRAIGKTIVTAVLAKDSDTLLVYDRDDLRLQDEASLKDKKGGLYCYLFGSSCVSNPKIPSVYEKLSTAHQLEVDASVMKSPDGRLYGTLVFYDKSQISKKRLYSSFVCTDEALKRIASWHFVRVGTKWNAATPFFDLDTDGLC
jgi:hypothetical protein